MAGALGSRTGITPAEHEAIVQDIMDNGLDNDGEFSDCPSEHSDHDTNSEVELDDISSESDDESDNEANQGGDSEKNKTYYYGKNKYKWATTPPAPSKTRASNIVTHLPGVTGEARLKKPYTPVQSWECLIDADILKILLENTNAQITEMSAKYNLCSLSCQFTNHVDMIEMISFLGLLYMAGVFKSNHEDLKSLFATDGTGRDIFRATMSLQRFTFLLCALRFDDKTTRLERISNGDKLAAISEIYNLFIINCQSNYSCGEYLTIDEMLIAFRGRCSFRMYLKDKPDKYGLKMQCLCDARTHYLFNGFIYTGKNTNVSNPRKLAVPTLDVLALIPPVANSNRNITADNWYTSLQLVTELQKHKLTFVGTMRKNKRELPSQFLPHKQRVEKSSVFGFTKDFTLASYVPKKNRAVILLSSMHHTDTICDNDKPEIIHFYNSTKGGVDSLDQKCSNYKVGRRTRRWPQVIWFRIMDIAGVNSNIIFNGIAQNKTMERRQFLTTLGRDLIQEQLMRQVYAKFMPRELRSVICRIANVAEPVKEPQPDEARGARGVKRGRCYICPYSQKKESLLCSNCSHHICKNHSRTITTCQNCEEAQGTKE